MGFRSGEYFGRKNNFAPADRIAWRMALPLWLPLAVNDVVRRMKGRSSHKVQREFPALKKRYWGRHFWARGYFCTTSGNVTDDIILQYIEQHADKPTGISR